MCNCGYMNGDVFMCDECVEIHQCYRCGYICEQNEFNEIHYISFKFGEFNGVCLPCLAGGDFQECYDREKGYCSLICPQCFDDVFEIECELARDLENDD